LKQTTHSTSREYDASAHPFSLISLNHDTPCQPTHHLQRHPQSFDSIYPTYPINPAKHVTQPVVVTHIPNCNKGAPHLSYPSEFCTLSLSDSDIDITLHTADLHSICKPITAPAKKRCKHVCHIAHPRSSQVLHPRGSTRKNTPCSKPESFLSRKFPIYRHSPRTTLPCLPACLPVPTIIRVQKTPCHLCFVLPAPPCRRTISMSYLRERARKQRHVHGYGAVIFVNHASALTSFCKSHILPWGIMLCVHTHTGRDVM
jgi:hypothetical protein